MCILLVFDLFCLFGEISYEFSIFTSDQYQLSLTLISIREVDLKKAKKEFDLEKSQHFKVVLRLICSERHRIHKDAQLKFQSIH